MRAWFEKADGEAVPFPTPSDGAQAAVAYLTHATGIRRIEDSTIDEFVRRADLYTTYMAQVLLVDGDWTAMTRKLVTDVMGEYVAAWTDAPLLTSEEFDRMIQQAKTNRLTNQQ